MKKYVLCDGNKRCASCGSSLQLMRKKAQWYYQRTQTPVERQTNIFYCKICRLDHVMKGDHIDESGWECLGLPIAELSKLEVYRKGSYKHSSKVTTYTDSTVKKVSGKPLTQRAEPAKAKPVKAQAKKEELDPKRLKGIKKSSNEYRKCGNCDFYIGGMCRTHALMTLSDEVCGRFKHFYKREVFGGAFSPR